MLWKEIIFMSQAIVIANKYHYFEETRDFLSKQSRKWFVFLSQFAKIKIYFMFFFFCGESLNLIDYVAYLFTV